MTSPGLDNRLKQHGRRAGIMVGLTMALTIALCVGAFTWIYIQVDPLTRDFVNAATAAPTKKPTAKPSSKAPTVGADATESTGGDQVAEAPPTRTPKPTATSDAFKATHIVSLSLESNVNLRPGPAVASGDPVANLQPGTELQYLNDTEDSQDPDADPGVQWMKVRTQDGIEGW